MLEAIYGDDVSIGGGGDGDGEVEGRVCVSVCVPEGCGVVVRESAGEAKMTLHAW